jgi:hypothetical protein
VSKIKSQAQLQNALDKEFAWRITEIIAIRLLLKSASVENKRAMCRAGIPILYAHWEGFVKQAAETYLNYVSNLGVHGGKLNSCFVAVGMRQKVQSVVEASRISSFRTAVEYVRECQDVPLRFNYRSAVSTQSNLTSAVLSDIIASLGLEIVPYESKFELIDRSLVKRRNEVAHGEYLDIDVSGFLDLSDNVQALMRSFKNDIENAIALRKYGKAN